MLSSCLVSGLRLSRGSFSSQVTRVFVLLRAAGLFKTVSAVAMVIDDRYLRSFDRIYGVRTSGYISLAETAFDSAKLHNATGYGPVSAWALRKLFNKLRLPTSLQFVDLGSGLGRACMLASEYGFSKVTGVELAVDLHTAALDNVSIWRSQHPGMSEIHLIQGDVLDYCEHAEDDVFFMYRPFG